jgi:hypothetical protein
MNDNFYPEYLKNPTELEGAEVLSKLPEHYLTTPTASNYVALGIVYTLMGLGIPEGVDEITYLDKTLMGVFTLVNEKASSLGLPPFEPPTPLSHPNIAKVAATIDNYMVRLAALEKKNSEENPYLFTLKYIFGPRTSHESSVKLAKVDIINEAITHLIQETGKPFPPPEQRSYQGVMIRSLLEAGVPYDMVDDGLSWVVLNKLQPTSTWVKNCDPSRSDLWRYFVGASRAFASDFRRTFVDKLKRERSDPGNSPEDFMETPTLEFDFEDLKQCLLAFRTFLVDSGSEYKGASVVPMFDMLLKGSKPMEIRSELGLDGYAYTQMYRKLRSAGSAFVKTSPQYRARIAPLLDSLD